MTTQDAAPQNRPTQTEDGFTIVYSAEELPNFQSEAEEHEFWKTHTWSEEMMDRAEPDPDLPYLRTKARATSLRLDENTLTRLRSLARKKGLPYQTLLKSFVLERLYEEEKREGILTASDMQPERES